MARPTTEPRGVRLLLIGVALAFLGLFQLLYSLAGMPPKLF